MTVVPPSAPPTLAERFARIIAGLCRTVAAQIAGGRLAAPMIVLIWTRLNRLGVRFARVAARGEAGTPPRRRRQHPRPTRPRPAKPCLAGPQTLPRGFLWLLRLVPAASSGASQVRYLLADPEITALIEAVPEAGRILRPLCHMLGIRPPPSLRLARPSAPDPEAAAVRPPPSERPVTPPPRSQDTAPPCAVPAETGACGPPRAG